MKRFAKAHVLWFVCLLMGLSVYAQPSLRLAAGSGNLEFYGYVPYALGWTEDNYGLYRFTATDPIRFERMPFSEDGPVAADGGGCYYDGKYYAVTYAGFMGMVMAEYCVYDTETWTMEKYIPVNAGSVATDIEMDPTTGYIYGAFYNDSFDGFVFGYMDPKTGRRTKICDLNRIFFGLSVNSKGEVYGLDEEGDLYKFDKVTGERTKVGNTGIHPEYLGSAHFNQKNNDLYWSVSRQDGSWLYLVDTETAQVTEVCKFPNDEEVQGMYIPIPAAEPDAPARATDLKVSFTDDALRGTFTFTMPDKTFDGKSSLQGKVGYEVYLNDVLEQTGEAEPGSVVDVPIRVLLYGNYKFSVRPKNDKGLAPAAYVSQWIGKDVPTAVTHLVAAEGTASNEVLLTWEAPTTTQHGGFLSVPSMTYSVERLQGETVTDLGVTDQLSFADRIENAGTIKAYKYRVTPLIDRVRKGEEALSNSIGVGAALSLPYYQPFSDEQSMDLMTIVDRHGDDKTWEYDPTFQAARAQYDWTNAKNEWLILPALKLTADRVYKVGFDTWARAGYVERFEVKMGQGKNYKNLKTDVYPRTEVRNDTPKHHKTLVKVDADGDYNFGFHALSDVDQWWLYLDNISIEAGPLLGTPNGVTGVSIKAGEKGALVTHISFTAPTETVDGLALSAIKEIKVLRNGQEIKSFTLAPGEKVELSDEEAEQGMNHYSIIPVNELGEGLEYVDSIYVGVDIPKAPKNVRLAKVNDKPVLTWEAPTEGVNGAYVDPEHVYYYIYRNDNAEIAERYDGLTITDETLELGDEQAFTTYAIYAQNMAGMSQDEYAMSNEVCFGKPFELPFHESFPGVSIEQNPWTWDIIYGDPWIKITDQGEYPNTTAQDGDGGLVSFQPEGDQDEAILYSSNISLVGAERPQLSFWYFNNAGSFDKISARVRIDDDPDKVDEVAFINMGATSGETGWMQATCDLAKYIGHRIQLAFKFTTASGYYMHLDNITVSGLRHDLPCVTDLCAARDGNTVSLTWSEPADEQGLGFIGYNVYRDGKLLNTDEPLIDPMYDDVIGAGESHKYQVTVVYEEGETTYSNTVDQDGVGNVTAVSDVKAGQAPYTYYNIVGQRLSRQPLKGMYILDSKVRIRK